ncbi:MAG: hypothetical protein ACK502_06025 [Alphaproteobacteria bacterium]
MHFLGAIFSGLFIALLVAVALTFGLALMGALLIVAFTTAAIFYGKQMWSRWRFKRNAAQSEGVVRIIEAEYTEIIRKED